MTITLLWKPEGEEPNDNEFRMLKASGSPMSETRHFTDMDQLVAHLTNQDWPVGMKPWVQTSGKQTLTPEEVMGYLPE